ncbi:ABC transporter substrate-binding protein [Pseudomonas syringae]|uniref:ABC transporter substrate-binding protein n=1 Tax=Pseudomonas syringae TaxID=317 RepID=A0A085VI56_PSESX|nr:ABC transporter substrate-binding protein [Pseudomonas syringae]KFE55119.1 ABC transporter substrate-binding protein [Pseudomonas syringae]
MHLLKHLVAGISLMLAGQTLAHATTYPLTVTDLSNRQVEIKQEPKRIVLQDGRDLFTLALLDRADPFQRIVAWNNIVKRSDPNTWQVFESQWPKTANQATDMKFGDDGDLNLEAVVAARPDLLIFQTRARASLENAGVAQKLAALNIPVLFVDSDLDPVVNSQKTVTLLGQVLNRETEAKAYVGFYKSRLTQIEAITAQHQKKPLVFVEAKAGQGGATACCFTHGDVYWGKLVQAAGGVNLGSNLLPGATGDVTLETVLGKQPDVYVMTGTRFPGSTSVSPPFGFGANVQQAAIDKSLSLLQKRPGFAQLKASQEGRVYGIYHQFYASSWNILALENLNQAFYPDSAKQLDPAASLKSMFDLTGIKAVPAILYAPAPANR